MSTLLGVFGVHASACYGAGAAQGWDPKGLVERAPLGAIAGPQRIHCIPMRLPLAANDYAEAGTRA